MTFSNIMSRRLNGVVVLAVGVLSGMGMFAAASAQQLHHLQETMTEARASELSRTAKTRTPIRKELTPEIMELLGDVSGKSRSNYGNGSNQSVFHYSNSLVPPHEAVRSPMRQTGHFAFLLDGFSYRCTASLISRSIAVTAGHCVHGGGPSGNYITSGTFYPARIASDKFPYGSAPVTSVITTTGWVNEGGLDQGYDVALLVLGRKNGNPNKQIGDVVGWYSFCSINCLKGYNFLSQIGYPHNYYSGVRMTLGQHLEVKSPSGGDYIYGSGMQGGSSGGPHILNHGFLSNSSADLGQLRARNVVFAVTSWGFINESIKIQGASSLSGPGNSNNFRSMYNQACDAARGLHGLETCQKF